MSGFATCSLPKNPSLGPPGTELPVLEELAGCLGVAAFLLLALTSPELFDAEPEDGAGLLGFELLSEPEGDELLPDAAEMICLRCCTPVVKPLADELAAVPGTPGLARVLHF